MVYRSLRTGSFFSGIGVADVATVFLGAALQESVGTSSAIGTFECAYACELDASCQHHLSALSPPSTHLFRNIFDFLPDEVERATREIEATSRTPWRSLVNVMQNSQIRGSVGCTMHPMSTCRYETPDVDKCPTVAFANLTTVMGWPLPACWVTGRGIGKFQHTCCGWPWQAWQAAPCTSEVDPSDLFGNGAVSRPRLLSVLFHGKKLVMLADVANVYERLCQSVHRRVHFACINGVVWRVCGEQATTSGTIYI
jgi:hypothetical protein